jgi:ATP-dependent exoDNAse (exonuclease V) beta subunit
MSKIKHSYNRILEISDDHKQVTLPDSRYYRRNGKYYPSVTYVLSSYPKGKHFEDWLKNMGRSADYIVKKAAEDGTQVHDLVEQYLLGEEINFLNKYDNPAYNPDIWLMFLRFVEFWETYNPKLIETEVHLFSDELKVAGTCDLICEIDDKLWLLDVKTSNHMQSTYELQTSIYGQCYKECYGKDIDNYGILWLKSSKRRPNKDKMQGKGWEVVLPQRTQEENLEIFKCVKTLFDLEHPQSSPSFTEFKTKVKREL